MATFRNAPAMWSGATDVHVVSNSVWERTAKFAWCGEKIGPDVQYDGDLVATCRLCLRHADRTKENE